MEEVKAASLELLDEPNLEEEAPLFIEEEAEPSEPEPLDEFAETPRPPIELMLTPFLTRTQGPVEYRSVGGAMVTSLQKSCR